MKFLVDAHLPPSLCAVLERHGHDANHTLDLPTKNATKDTILNRISVDEQRIIVSKDSDFQQRSLLRGSPPKFIWLRVGNCKVKRIEDLLRRYSAAIHTFGLDDSKSHLMLP